MKVIELIDALNNLIDGKLEEMVLIISSFDHKKIYLEKKEVGYLLGSGELRQLDMQTLKEKDILDFEVINDFFMEDYDDKKDKGLQKGVVIRLKEGEI